MRRVAIILGSIVLLFGTAFLAAPPVSAQQTIQMRPDEMVWNALRDRSDRTALELFIATFPDSPYVGEARDRLAAMPAVGSPPAPALPTIPSAPLPLAPPDAVPVESEAAGKPILPGRTVPTAIMERSVLRRFGVLVEEREGGLFATGLPAGSPFAGLVSEGDRLVRLNGEPLQTIPDLLRALKALAGNTTPAEVAVEVQGAEKIVTSPKINGAPIGLSLGTAIMALPLDAAPDFVPYLQRAREREDPEYYANAIMAHPDLPAGQAMVELFHLQIATPSPPPAASMPGRAEIDSAQRAFSSLKLSDEEVLRLFRALHGMGMFGKLREPITDFSGFGALQAVRQFQKARGFPATGYLTPEQIAYLVPLGGERTAVEDRVDALQKLADLDEAESDFAARADLAQRALQPGSPALGDSPAYTESDKERLYLSLQKLWGLPPAGLLTEELIDRVLEVEVPLEDWEDMPPVADMEELDASDAIETFGDWRFGKDLDECFIWTYQADSNRIGGKFNGPLAPSISISADRQKGATSLGFFMVEARFFDANQPVDMEGGASRARLVMRSHVSTHYRPPVSNGAVSDGFVKVLLRAPAITILGTSKFGGPLVIPFSAQGFTKAFRRMNEVCTQGGLTGWTR